jgi:hypothetical protein
MTNTEKKEEKERSINRRTNISLGLAIVALFGVFPLSYILGNLYCGIFECPRIDDMLRFVGYLCFASPVISFLAIVIGATSLYDSEKGDPSRSKSIGGIVLGVLAILLTLVTLIVMTLTYTHGLFYRPVF